MPNYVFKITPGNHVGDHELDLPNLKAARKEAMMIFSDMARGITADLNDGSEWRLDVIDESGKSAFRLRLLAG